ncbi:selenium-dependent molybdenum cofactor biosynthesis protein YqeB [Candidatus Leptofilum sp.]|uniref:selenium-dependent molybdenum cofactor biosynthesis protein YqeB n=1 Tax=Candidatus Leptofilum sp. TaxID=3241576 RepID=UPI003B5A0077
MLFPNQLVILRGGGDLATGVAFRLHHAGFPVIVLELERPLVVRRKVAVATAVLEGHIQIETLHAQRAETVEQAIELAHLGTIPVLVAPELSVISKQYSVISQPSLVTERRLLNTVYEVVAQRHYRILVDARMAKRNIDTNMEQANLVIALGPGFTTGVDCHAVIETMRGHTLGRVIWQGSALPNTGTPGIVAGKGAERVLRAPAAGKVNWRLEIGDLVTKGQIIGNVAGKTIVAPFAGVLRGLIAPSTEVRAGLKIGDLDARADVSACFTISDKALAIGGGVLEAVLTHLNQKL